MIMKQHPENILPVANFWEAQLQVHRHRWLRVNSPIDMGEHPVGQLFWSVQRWYCRHHLLHDRSMGIHDVHDRIHVGICEPLAQFNRC
jgi:hypothetical protein